MIASFINNILPFLVILTVLVFVHELGHYLVARLNGVKVEVFSIGFGNELFGFEKVDLNFTICASIRALLFSDIF